jgi:hypothetical protein
MSVIAAAVKHMLACGMPHATIVAAVAEMEAGLGIDEQAERRRAKDRERKRAKAPRNSAESAETAERAEKPAPKDITQTPTPEDKGEGARDPHRLPGDFALSEADRQFARDLGWSDAEISDEFSGFVDYWGNPKLPGSKALKTNWSVTWRNRIRDLSKRRGHAQRPDAQRSFRVVNGSNGHVQTARGSAAQFLRADIERELREAGGEGERIRSLEFLPQLGRG